MRRRIGIVRWLLLVIVGWTGAGLLVPEITERRRFESLDLSPEFAEDLPPDVAVLTVVLGSFRGLMVDILWERASFLQAEGKFHEAEQLARWITKLQPKFERVWEHLAWNLTHNIAIATHTPEERWSWVQAGLRLLRDEGIPQNPLAMSLHRALAWTFLHKISGASDEFHLHYKIEFLKEWEAILGVPPESDEERIEWFRPIAEAPGSESELFREHPELQARRDHLRAHGLSLGPPLLAAHAEIEGSRDHPLRSWWHDLDSSERGILRAFSQAQGLRDVYRMDPRLMYDLMREVGPLDWRHASSHCLYWTIQGQLRWLTRTKHVRIERRREIDGGVFQDDLDLFYGYQHTTLALQHLLEGGFLHYDATSGDYRAEIDPRFLDPYMQSQSIRFERGRLIPEEFKQMFEQTLRQFAFRSYLSGDETGSTRALGLLRREFPQKPLYQGEAEDFVRDVLDPADSSAEEVELRIVRMLLGGLVEGRGSPRVDGERVWQRTHHWARQFYDDASRRFGISFPNLAELERQALRGYLLETPRRVSLKAKARVWAKLTDRERESMLDPEVCDRLYRQAERAGIDPKEYFPLP